MWHRAEILCQDNESKRDVAANRLHHILMSLSNSMAHGLVVGRRRHHEIPWPRPRRRCIYEGRAGQGGPGRRTAWQAIIALWRANCSKAAMTDSTTNHDAIFVAPSIRLSARAREISPFLARLVVDTWRHAARREYRSSPNAGTPDYALTCFWVVSCLLDTAGWSNRASLPIQRSR